MSGISSVDNMFYQYLLQNKHDKDSNVSQKNNKFDIPQSDIMNLVVTDMRHSHIQNLGPSEAGNSKDNLSSKIVDNVRSFSEMNMQQVLSDSIQSLSDTLTQNTLYLKALLLKDQEVLISNNDINVVEGKVSDSFFVLPEQSSEVTISVLDKHNNTVYQRQLRDMPEGEHSFEWMGNDSQGKLVSDGIYKIHVSAKDVDGKNILADKMINYFKSKIANIDFGNTNIASGQLFLKLMNGMKFPEEKLSFI